MLKQLAKILGGSNERVIKKLDSDVKYINDLEPEFGLLSDGELEAKTQEFKDRLNQGEDLEDIFMRHSRLSGRFRNGHWDSATLMHNSWEA